MHFLKQSALCLPHCPTLLLLGAKPDTLGDAETPLRWCRDRPGTGLAAATQTSLGGITPPSHPEVGMLEDERP